MEKKKAGRPKKVVKTAPKIKVEYKEAYFQALEVIDELQHQQIEEAAKRKAVWVEKAKELQKKNEALFNLVKELVDTAVNDLVQIEVTTGKITALDAIYHVSMIERIMEAQFNPETEE
jgi:hypothetical protein